MKELIITTIVTAICSLATFFAGRYVKRKSEKANTIDDILNKYEDLCKKHIQLTENYVSLKREMEDVKAINEKLLKRQTELMKLVKRGIHKRK